MGKPYPFEVEADQRSLPIKPREAHWPHQRRNFRTLLDAGAGNAFR